MDPVTVATGKTGILHGSLWSPTSPRGVVIMIHGLGDYGSRFRRFAADLVAAGWAVLALDLPGHGDSPGRRGDAKYSDLLMHVAAARRQMSERFPGRVQVVFGHSMGGNLAINYSLRRDELHRGNPPDLGGVILCAPMLMPPRSLPRPQIFAAWLTGRMVPWWTLSAAADVGKLTGDELAAQAIREDPHRHSRLTLRLGTDLIAQGRFAMDRASDVDVPTMILFGDADDLIDQHACRHLAMRIGDHAECQCWAGQRHDLLHDTGATAVTGSIASWLQTTPLGIQHLPTDGFSRAA